MGNTFSRDSQERPADSCDDAAQQAQQDELKGVSFRVHDVKPVVDINSLPSAQASTVIRSRFLDNDEQKLVKNALSAGDKLLLTKTPLKNQFVSAIVLAFDMHLELVLRPQHFWLAVTQAVALHVATYEEELRSKIVHHTGRKVLEVDVTDQALRGLTAADWEEVVESFTAQIQAFTVDGVSQSFQCNMSSTEPAERVAINMTVMDACKSFFEYRVTTCCGFPKIHMQGTLKDWQLLQSRTHALVTAFCTQDFASSWLAALHSVFNKFIAAYSQPEVVDVEFWESMAKRGGTKGSGASTYVNGWINNFYPYCARNKTNPFCGVYSSGAAYTQQVDSWTGERVLKQAGLDVFDFPDGLCSAPVMIDENLLEFRGGFVGVDVDRENNCLTPSVGWFVARGASKRTKDLLDTESAATQEAFDANTMKLPNVSVTIELEDFAYKTSAKPAWLHMRDYL